MASRSAFDQGQWFCVEDCRVAHRPVVLLSAGTLAECHRFMEHLKATGRVGVFRLNYSAAMRNYVRAAGSRAA